MAGAPVRKIGMIILAILCSYLVAQYFSTGIVRVMNLHGPEMYLASFILFAVIFLLVMSGLQRALGIFILDEERLR